MFIDGEWCEAASGGRFEVTDPATGEVIGDAPDGTAEDAVRAVEAADRAFAAWSTTTAKERADLLYAAWQLMNDRAESLAELMTREQGKPLRASRNEVAYAGDFLRFYAEEATRVTGEWLPSARADQRFLVLRQPVGVVGMVTPWNYPISMLTRKMGPALAAGCTLVLKPAEATPLCAKAVFEVFVDAGVPDGVINMVTAADPAPIGEVFTTHPDVRKITFTGSTAVGRRLAGAAAANLKRVSVELGGHAPFIVFPDADPVRAAKGAAALKFLNAGQACISPNRLYVHADAADAFTETMADRVAKVRAGNGFTDGVGVGPLVNEAAVAKVAAQVDDAVAKGAKVEVGGKTWDNFVEPTVLTNVNADMDIWNDETFGPVVMVVPFRTEEEAIALNNDTDYGLTAAIWTDDEARALEIAGRLETGMVHVNCQNVNDEPHVPFGGVKASGVGRYGGRWSLDAFTELRWITLDRGGRHFPPGF